MPYDLPTDITPTGPRSDTVSGPRLPSDNMTDDPSEVRPTPPPAPKVGPERTTMQSADRYMSMGGTGVINAGLEMLGIPGAVGQATEEMRKAEAAKPKAERDKHIPGDVGAALAVSYLFNHLIGQHLPSGDQLKEAFWKHAEPAGLPRVEPETGPEKVAVEGVKALTPSVASKASTGAKSLAGLSGMVGELAANMSEEHPHIARFLGNIGTLLGGTTLAAGAKKGTQLTKDVLAARNPEGQERLAAQGLLRASGEEDPAALAARIRAGNKEVVPRSSPTTPQAADSVNLQDALATERTANPALAREIGTIEADQNAARLAQASKIGIGGAPEDVRNYLQTIRDNAKQHVDNIEQSAAEEVKKRFADLGPGVEPQKAGQVIREVAENSLDQARQKVAGAYSSVIGPGRGKEISVDPGPAMRRIDYMMRQRFGDKNPAPSQLTDLVEAVRNDKQGLSYKDMNDLVTRSSDLAGKLKDSRNAQAAALKIRDILLDRMDASASNTAKILPYTRDAEVEASTIRERVTRLNELRDINQQPPLKRWAASRDALEDQIKKLEGKVKADFGISGDLNPQEWARYQHAREMRTQVSQRYEQGPMGDILARGSRVGGHDLSESQVPGAFFHSRTSAPDDIRQFDEAMGGHANAMASLREYAIGHLNATAEAKGGLTPELLTKWMNDHQASLKPFPELRRELSGIKDSADLSARVVEGHRADLETYQKSAARHFLSPDPLHPVDPAVAIASALKPTNKFAASDMSQLARMAKIGGEDAIAGLRRGVVDHIIERTSGKLDASGTPVLMNEKFNNWMRANRDKVAGVFEPEHLAALDRIGRDLQRGTLGTGTSTGPLTLAQAMKSALGGYQEMIPGIPLAGKKIYNLLFSKSQAQIHDAFNKMLVDPEAAAAGLDKISSVRADSSIKKLFGDMATTAPGPASRAAAHAGEEPADAYPPGAPRSQNVEDRRTDMTPRRANFLARHEYNLNVTRENQGPGGASTPHPFRR